MDLSRVIKCIILAVLSLSIGCSGIPHKDSQLTPIRVLESQNSQKVSQSGIEYLQVGGGPKVLLLYTGVAYAEGMQTLLDRVAQSAEIFAVNIQQPHMYDKSISSITDELVQFFKETQLTYFHLIAIEEAAALGTMISTETQQILSAFLIEPVFYENSEDDLPLTLDSRDSKTALRSIEKLVENDEDRSALVRSIERFKLSAIPKKLFYGAQASKVDQSIAQNYKLTFNRLQIFNVGIKEIRTSPSMSKIAASISSDLSKSH